MNINWNKVKNWALAVVTILLLGVSSYTLFLANEYHEQSTALTAKDAELQNANLKIGLSESKLVKGNELEKELRIALKGMEDEFKVLVEEYNLKIKSKDQTIVSLRRRITDGTTTVVINNGPHGGTDPGVSIPCTDGLCPSPKEFEIAYSWTDKLGRFQLRDPDIWTENNEIFESQQYFKLEGYVFEAKDGQLQTRKVEVTEVDKDGNVIPGGKIELVSSNFTYTNRSIENQKPGVLDILTLRPYVSFDTALTPGLGLEILNFGKFFPYGNVGIGPYLAADIRDLLGGSLYSSRVGIHTQYHLVPPLLDTNIAVGLGVGVPFNDLSKPTLTLSFIFYLTPDLNPLGFWKDRPELFGIKL